MTGILWRYINRPTHRYWSKIILLFFKNQFAIKVEKTDNKHAQIYFEAKLYSHLHQNSKQDIGIPKIYFCGTDSGYNLMVIELLGKSLETLFKENNV